MKIFRLRKLYIVLLRSSNFTSSRIFFQKRQASSRVFHQLFNRIIKLRRIQSSRIFTIFGESSRKEKFTKYIFKEVEDQNFSDRLDQIYHTRREKEREKERERERERERRNERSRKEVFVRKTQHYPRPEIIFHRGKE